MKVDYLGHFGNDQMVANVARVSFNKWKDTFDENDEKLITYLAKHNHKSPFFHPKIQLRVHVPLFVANQLKKHQVGFDINEVSRRYVDTKPEMYQPKKWRLKAKDKKQGSSKETVEVWNMLTQVAFIDCVQIYEHLIEEGIAPEQARMLLPQAMYTTFIWTGSLYGYFNMHKLRSAPDSQLETQEVANMIKDIIAPLFPFSWEALANA